MIVKTLGERIRYARTRKHTTQEQLAKQLYVARNTVSSWECNRTEPELYMMVKLSKCLDVSLDFLFTGKPEPEKS